MRVPGRGMTGAADRLFGVDVLKALGCVLIVWHHLAFYGPMSDVVHPFAPVLIGGLYEYARMVVQVFLVVGGFLAAAQLMPDGRVALRDAPARLILRRYQRLVVPLLAALLLSLGVAALVRTWLDHPSVPGVPELGQLLAHGLLLQDLLGIEALSAGVWYVAIDFQLYALAVALAWVGGRMQRRWAGALVALTVVLTMLSLFWWNRVAALDATALYFCGAYGLGMLAYWASRSGPSWRWGLALAALGGMALAVDWRARIAVALLTALLLLVTGGEWRRGTARHHDAVVPFWRRGVSALARMSYSVFLVHFPVCLLVNALVSLYWPAEPWVNALGMVAAFGLSLQAGRWLHVHVESRRATRRTVLGYQAALLLGGVAVLTLGAGG